MLSILVKPHSTKLPNLIDACYGHAKYVLSKYWLLSLYLVHTKYVLSIYLAELVPKGPFDKRSFCQKVLWTEGPFGKGPLVQRSFWPKVLWFWRSFGQRIFRKGQIICSSSWAYSWSVMSHVLWAHSWSVISHVRQQALPIQLYTPLSEAVWPKSWAQYLKTALKAGCDT